MLKDRFTFLDIKPYLQVLFHVSEMWKPHAKRLLQSWDINKIIFHVHTTQQWNVLERAHS